MRHGRDLDRLLARAVAGRVDRVDANVADRTTAECRTQADVRSGHVLAVAGREGPDGTKGLLGTELHDLAVEGLIVEPVGDHQLAVGLLGGCDPLLALGYRHGHWLLTEHVLASLQGAD